MTTRLATMLLAVLLAAATAASGSAAEAPGAGSVEPRPGPAPEAHREPEARLVRSFCEAVGGKLASVDIGECLALELEPTGAVTHHGWPVLQREYPPLAHREPRGRVLVLGGIHGDEYSSVSVVFKWMSILKRFHSGLFHWRVVPLLNPDGLLRERSQRMNANGVDLNRNFPTPNWESESRDYWETRTYKNPRRYPGESPLSEPESAWLAQEIESFRPDVVVSVHAPAHTVDFDGPPHPPNRLGSLRLKPLGTYPGSLGRYLGVHKGIPVVTIELASAISMPSTGEYTSIWIDLVAWLKTRLPPRQETARLGPTEAAPWPPQGPPS